MGLFTPNFEHEYGLIEKAAAEAARAGDGGSAREDGKAAEIAAANTTTGSSATMTREGTAPKGKIR
jgi:hypothetical protein